MKLRVGHWRAAATLLALLLASLLASACGDTGGEETTGQVDTLTRRAGEVFASARGSDSEYPGNMITAAQLYAVLNDPARADEFFLLDTRPTLEVENQGSIAGSTWIEMQSIAKPESLAELPTDKTIVCISPTGHTANQVCTTLRWLGYDAVLLKYGMGSWTQTVAGRDITAGDARRAMDFPYPVVDAAGPATVTANTPTVSTLPPVPPGDYEDLRAAADELMSNNVLDQEYPFNHITAKRLHDRLADPVLAGETFLLDIRDPAVYRARGHIEGAIDIPWRELGQPENLVQLPHGQLIVVIGDNGRDAGQVTPILKMLGYDAVTLRSGMAGWSPTPETQEILDAVAAAHYPVVGKG